MSFYYPQAAVTLRVVFEDFKTSATTKLPIHVMNITPKKVTVNINDYTHADAFDMELDYQQFPFDPRTIRACGVTIHMQDMGKLMDTIPLSESNIVFVGFVDDGEIQLSDDNRTVTLRGRDYTSIFADVQFPLSNLDTTLPLDECIEDLIEELPQAEKIEVINRTGLAKLPSVASFSSDFELHSKRNGHKNRNESYWDVIQDIISQSGLIAYVELDKIIVTKPRVLYGDQGAKQFVYGKNLKSLEFKRKLGRKKAFNLQVLSYDFTKNAPVVVHIPKMASVEWCKSMSLLKESVTLTVLNPDGSESDKKQDAPFVTFRFANKTEAQCIQLGQSIYEELGKQQIDGSFTTLEMKAPEYVDPKTTRPFDITKMRVGTAVEIFIDQDDLDALKHPIENQKDFLSRQKFLIARGYAAPVARALAESLGKLHHKFYTKSVQLTVDAEQGFQMKVEFLNEVLLDNKALGI